MKPHYKILIFERRKKTGEILKSVFENSGYDPCIISTMLELPDDNFEVLITEVPPETNLEKEWVLKNCPSLKIIYILNFSRDSFIEKLYRKSINTLIDKSYKIKDLIKMTDVSLQTTHQEIGKITNYLSRPSEIINTLHFSINPAALHEIDATKEVIDSIDSTLDNFNLKEKIEDLNMFYYSIGELIDNTIEAQMQAQLSKIDFLITYGFDDDKCIFSIKDSLGTLTFNDIYNGIKQAVYGSKSINKNNNGELELAPRGRGYFIIQYSVHRLHVAIISPETAVKLNLLPQSTITSMVYFNKKNATYEAQLGSNGIVMIVLQ